jgi:hypothetical protein
MDNELEKNLNIPSGVQLGEIKTKDKVKPGGMKNISYQLVERYGLPKHKLYPRNNNIKINHNGKYIQIRKLDREMLIHSMKLLKENYLAPVAVFSTSGSIRCYTE